MQGSFQMSEKSRGEYFRVLAERYQKETSKKYRTKLIDEACENTSLHRKSIIRALRRVILKKVPITRPGRPRAYSEASIFILKRLYRESEFQCSGKLHSMIPVLLKQYKMNLNAELEKEILRISPASIDRYLKKYRKLQSIKSRTLTRPGSKLFRRKIPLKNLSNIARSPGIMEGDTVGHCGGNLNGEFVFSLTMTDELTGYTLNRATKNKCAANVKPAIEMVINKLPFGVTSANFDNGTEFLNHIVYNYFIEYAKEKGVLFPMTRSRSYQKNDNARAEQKNWTHVRQLFGYDRIEGQESVDLMNEIYEVHNLIHNFFIPQYKLKSKVRVGAKIIKKYDKPKTPYQRLLESDLPEENKQKLREQYAKLDYPTLKKKKEELLTSFIKLQERLKLERRAQSKSQGNAQPLSNT